MALHRHHRMAEQEKVERSRPVPFHVQLNLDVIECVYFVSAMLFALPYISEHEFDAKPTRLQFMLLQLSDKVSECLQ